MRKYSGARLFSRWVKRLEHALDRKIKGRISISTKSGDLVVKIRFKK